MIMTAIDYDEAVRVAHELEERRQWVLGDLANRLKPKYGAETLQRFADDIGVHYNTLRDYRAVVRNWPETEEQNHGRPSNWSVAKELYAQEDRYELVAENPDMNSHEARVLVAERKGVVKPAPANSSCATKPPVNTVAWGIKAIKSEWRDIKKNERRLITEPDETDITQVEKLVGSMMADLMEIKEQRREHHS